METRAFTTDVYLRLNMTQKYSNFPKGSEWRRWDLHVHTKGTKKNDQFMSLDFDSFCIDMFKRAIAADIHAIGITDYFCLENYKKVKDFVNNIDSIPSEKLTDEEKSIIKCIFILPNVELRMLPSTDSGKLINIHCLINPEFVDVIERNYFPEIKFSAGVQQKYPMTKEGFIRLGLSINSTLNEEEAYKKGHEQFVVTHSNLHELYDQNAEFKKAVLFVVSNNSNDGNSGLQKHYDLFENENGALDSVRNSIYKLSHAIFSSNPRDIKYFSGKSIDDEKTVQQKCGSLKACIHGSDAHTEEKLFKPDQDRYCWIKSDLTFDGLKQILYEPEGRVRIQQSKPDEKNDYEVIESIELLPNSQDFNPQKILLNPNLNTIIGGRSSGKSALLAVIAEKCGAYPKLGDKSEEVENSYKRYLDTLSPFVTVHWQDGKSDTAHPIEYFPQGFLNTRQAEGLESVISPIFGGDETLESYKRAFENEQRETSLELTNQLSELFRLKNEMTVTHLKIKELGEKEDIEKALKAIKDKSDLLTQATSIGPDQKASYEQNVSKLQIINERVKQNSADKIQLEVFKDKEVINTSLLQQFDSFSVENKNKLDDAFSKIALEAKQKWKLEVENIISVCTDTIRADKSSIEQIESDSNFKATKDKFAQTTELSELQKKIQQEKARLAEVEKESKAYRNLSENYNSQKAIIKNTWDKYWSNIYGVAQKLKMSKNSQNPVADNLSVFTKVQLKNEYYEFLTEVFNQQSSVGMSLVNYQYESHEKYSEHVCQLFERALEGDMPWKGIYRQNQEKFINDLLSNNWYELKHDVTYGGDSFEQMSAGKKAFVVLKLILDFSKRTCPILIDQPEDDLDNRAIYSELVTYIKSKKIDRQIILVTHNANVVVNADSELVIVANQQGSSSPNTSSKKFEYVAGSLEFTKTLNTSESLTLYRQGIREHVCEILEGGGRAFKLREKKYALSD